MSVNLGFLLGERGHVSGTLRGLSVELVVRSRNRATTAGFPSPLNGARYNRKVTATVAQKERPRAAGPVSTLLGRGDSPAPFV